MTDFNHDPRKLAADQRFWRANLLLISVLLSIWALVSLGAGILWIEPLNQFKIGSIPLGFWVAQQGAIIAFVLIIAAYVLLIGPLERRHRTEVHAIHLEYENRTAAAATQPGGQA
jgi:putative solute:sodium symporter small subunit